MTKDLLLRNGQPRIDLDKCYFPFYEAALNVLAACRERGQDYYPISGFRNWISQHKLYGDYLAGRGGKAAPAGLSAHNYGIAWDLAADGDEKKPGLQPSWNLEKYKILGEEAAKAGLVWGGSFNDSPHIQWPSHVNADQLRLLRKIWNDCPDHATEDQKLRSVWQYLDSLRGDV